MGKSETYWFSPAPSEAMPSRVTLDFGLRAADLYFRELVVPGIGSTWFTRQLSWPLAALLLHEEHACSGLKPTEISHGIEALACKLEYREGKQSNRVLGKRAFRRDEDDEVWSFASLRSPSNYVRNTHRQTAVRAIRTDVGLGFASGSRYDLFELEPVGRELAKVFLGQRVGQGGTPLRSWLVKWLNGDQEISRQNLALRDALSPESPSGEEKQRIKSRLLCMATPAGDKRLRLATALGRGLRLREIEGEVMIRLVNTGHHEQANEIATARAFGAMLDRSRDAVMRLTHVVEPERCGVALKTLTDDSTIRRAVEDVRSAANAYMERADTAEVNEPTSRDFAEKVPAGDDRDVIRLLVERSGKLLAILADGSVVRGSLFRPMVGSDENAAPGDDATSTEPDRTGRTFRIANFHSLLRDVNQPDSR